MTFRYRHCGFVLLRSTTDPGTLCIPDELDLDDPDAVHGDGRAWLAKTWTREDVKEALTIASPGLASRVDRLLAADRTTRPKDLRCVLLSVTSYLVRWNRRSTPFGLFAGVMPVTTRTPVRPPAAQRVLARPDASWITTVTSELERDPMLRPHLTLTADSTALIRDGRVIIARRERPGAAGPGPVREASVRSTRPMRAALDIAASPVRYRDLVTELSRRFPSAPSTKIRALLDTLVDEGFLLTSLRTPMTATDPLAHLTSALRAAGAEHAASTARLLRELDHVREQLRAHNESADPETSAGLRARAVERMEAIAPADWYPLAVDVRLGDSQVRVPSRVLDEAAAAAQVLVRLTSRPFGSMAWVEYHARFRERYGPGALVPVSELLSDAGLGYPDGYLNSRRARPAHRMLTERDAAMLTLIQQAAFDGTDEIVLTEPVIESLVIDRQADMVAPQRVELGVTLHSASEEAIGRGDFELRVVAAPRVPTSMAGRFAHLLTEDERNLLAASYRAGKENTLPVQLSFPPRVPRNENVVRVEPLLDHVLPVGEHPPGGAETVRVEDLAVTADAVRFYLVHVPSGRRVTAWIPHALEMTMRTPPLARFLAQIADARSAGFGPLDPGAARVLPFLPRFRYRRTILAPARWILSSSDVNGGDWTDQLSQWRHQWKVPARVTVSGGEPGCPWTWTGPWTGACCAPGWIAPDGWSCGRTPHPGGTAGSGGRRSS